LKQALCKVPVLQAPDFCKEFVLVTNTSDLAVPAVLHQRVDGELAPISYYSRLLTPAEMRYSTYENECLDMVLGAMNAMFTSNIKSLNSTAKTWPVLVAQGGEECGLPGLLDPAFGSL